MSKNFNFSADSGFEYDGERLSVYVNVDGVTIHDVGAAYEALKALLASAGKSPEVKERISLAEYDKIEGQKAYIVSRSENFVVLADNCIDATDYAEEYELSDPHPDWDVKPLTKEGMDTAGFDVDSEVHNTSGSVQDVISSGGAPLVKDIAVR